MYYPEAYYEYVEMAYAFEQGADICRDLARIYSKQAALTAVEAENEAYINRILVLCRTGR